MLTGGYVAGFLGFGNCFGYCDCADCQSRRCRQSVWQPDRCRGIQRDDLPHHDLDRYGCYAVGVALLDLCLLHWQEEESGLCQGGIGQN